MVNPTKSLNQLFEDYVYHSFLYYECDQPEITDYEYDMLCRHLLANWSQVTHPDRGLSDESSLDAGTGCQMSGMWPKWVYDRARAAGVEHWSMNQQPVEVAIDQPEVIVPQRKFVYWTGVGSRETPQAILNIMRRLGKAQCDRGFRGRSGCAPGADTNFWHGAMESSRYDEVGFDNFLPDSWMFNRPEFGNIVPDTSRRIFDATKFDTYEQAQEIAFKARGSFEGLGPGGIRLHTRNVYQVLGPTLDEPSRALVCWAPIVGRRGKVKGGTNTAVQIALEYAVEVINLFLEKDLNRIVTYLKNVEN